MLLHDDTYRPYIYLVVMTPSALFKDFWRNIIWRATERSSSSKSRFLVRNENGSKTKVANLYIHVGIQEEVSHLQIPMYNISLVHVLDRTTKLNCDTSHFW